MMEQEGVIKFELVHRDQSIAKPVNFIALLAWRKILMKLDMIGQSTARYDGIGFGNVSMRLDGNQFLITGTQTAHIEETSIRDFAKVTNCDFVQHAIFSEGQRAPSSESVTHAVLYNSLPEAQYIFHVHSPDIWKHRRLLNLPSTPDDIPYGTKEMSEAVQRLALDQQLPCGIIAMGGHEDGIISYGKTAQEAGILLVNTLAESLQRNTVI